jgi:hypothetical protein
LFYTLFKEVMVFDTIFHGTNYREHCIKQNKHCPTIITIEDGETIEVRSFLEISNCE